MVRKVTRTKDGGVAYGIGWDDVCKHTWQVSGRQNTDTDKDTQERRENCLRNGKGRGSREEAVGDPLSWFWDAWATAGEAAQGQTF